MFLRSLGSNPVDVHLHTSINLRCYLLKLDGISLKNKLLLLLTWQSGPEIRSTAGRIEPYRQPDMKAVAAPCRSAAIQLDPRAVALDAPRPRRPAAAISFGKNMTVYEEYLELLHAA